MFDPIEVEIVRDAPPLPKGWKELPLGQVMTLQRGFDLPHHERKPGSIPIISSAGVSGSHSVEKCQGPGVVTGRYGSLGNVHWVDGGYWPLNTALFVQSFHANDPRFVFYLLQSVDLQKVGDKTGVPGVNRNDVHKFVVRRPPLDEQRRIAAILRTWDKAIDAVSSLVAAKTRRRQAIRDQVFSRNHAGAQMAVLAEITDRVDRGSDGREHPLMTVASQRGFVLQSDKYARDMAGESAQSYTLLRRGEFAYNKGNSLTYPQGCIFRLDQESALLPFVYFCFALRPGFKPDYYAQLFSAGYLNGQLSRLIKTGVRNNGLLNINADEFFSVNVPVPSRDQQIADAKILDDVDREIAATERYRDALQRQKRGLMQKLLTGEWRTTADAVEAAE